MACSTTTLALGSRQLAAQGAIVTRLTAIEEMAGMTLLCSDKTGTLTLNQMVIQVGYWLTSAHPQSQSLYFSVTSSYDVQAPRREVCTSPWTLAPETRKPNTNEILMRACWDLIRKPIRGCMTRLVI